MNPAATRVREALRQRLQGDLMLDRIEQVTRWLLSGHEEVKCGVTGAVTLVPLDRERIVALKVVLDTQLKLLGKILPDLKAVELKDDDGVLQGRATTDRLVLATKLLAVMREGQEHGNGVAALDFLQ